MNNLNSFLKSEHKLNNNIFNDSNVLNIKLKQKKKIDKHLLKYNEYLIKYGFKKIEDLEQPFSTYKIKDKGNRIFYLNIYISKYSNYAHIKIYKNGYTQRELAAEDKIFLLEELQSLIKWVIE